MLLWNSKMPSGSNLEIHGKQSIVSSTMVSCEFPYKGSYNTVRDCKMRWTMKPSIILICLLILSGCFSIQQTTNNHAPVLLVQHPFPYVRSEERRVGKECRSR